MKELNGPFSKERLSGLKAGDMVMLSGELLTGRDAAHARMFGLISSGKKLPVDLKGKIIYYVGPTPAKKAAAEGSAGPTTSSRMDRYTPALLRSGLSGMVGKGRRSKTATDAIIKNKAVYFITFGGAGAYLSKRIKSSKVIAYGDLGTEAVRSMKVESFPAIVAIDQKGRKLKGY